MAHTKSSSSTTRRFASSPDQQALERAKASHLKQFWYDKNVPPLLVILAGKQQAHSELWPPSDASPRQMGQVRLPLSHLSTQRAWNSWPQGSTRITWRASKSHMHTTHEVCSEA